MPETWTHPTDDERAIVAAERAAIARRDEENRALAAAIRRRIRERRAISS